MKCDMREVRRFLFCLVHTIQLQLKQPTGRLHKDERMNGGTMESISRRLPETLTQQKRILLQLIDLAV